MEENFKNIAVLIDAENISSKYLQYIFEKVAAYGEISVRRIYGDWTQENMKSWKSILQEHAIHPIQQFSNTQGKNSTDSSLIIDAMDLLYKEYFDCFCIVSSDSDFTRLAQRIREQGKYVLGIGENKTPISFRKGCNDFVIIEEIKEGKTEKKIEKKSKDVEENIVIEKAFDELSRSGEWILLSKVVQYVKQILPDFDAQKLGVKKPLDYFKKNSTRFSVKYQNENGPGAVYICRIGEKT